MRKYTVLSNEQQKYMKSKEKLIVLKKENEDFRA